MKLRIRGDSIRLRVGRSEVQRLLREGSIEEVTHFPKPRTTTFRYRLCAIDDDGSVDCVFEDNTLTVRIPFDVAQHWATTEEVSIRAAQPIEDAVVLKILIEKDFECLDGSSEDCQDDAFANPRRAALDHVLRL